MKNQLFILLAVLVLAALACRLAPGDVDGGNTSSSLAPTEPVGDASSTELQTMVDQLPAGDARRGEQIFTSTQTCHACHMDQSVGPRFPGEPPLATLAETRKTGYPPAVYLYESIVSPSAYVVKGFQDGIMPEDYGKLLTQQDLADLVEYLLSLR